MAAIAVAFGSQAFVVRACDEYQARDTIVCGMARIVAFCANRADVTESHHGH
jgi:hypothetical protein